MFSACTKNTLCLQGDGTSWNNDTCAIVYVEHEHYISMLLGEYGSINTNFWIFTLWILGTMF